MQLTKPQKKVTAFFFAGYVGTYFVILSVSFLTKMHDVTSCHKMSLVFLVPCIRMATYFVVSKFNMET